ncbi:uncharacterized protein LOC131938707 [Physella acuta]|uniref:uncharacterized protein LOC131938707 n=1 Tax=Physella acuta TaxID=109671 RepID=UPI0027DCC8FB|nr:uncharacterized protein LOC131938707 [Physella acuta]
MASKELSEDLEDDRFVIVQKGNTLNLTGNITSRDGITITQTGNTSNNRSVQVNRRENDIAQKEKHYRGNVTNEASCDVNSDIDTSAYEQNLHEHAEQTRPIHGNLQSNHSQLLRRETEYLLDEIDADFLTDHLFAKYIIGREGQMKISQQTSSKERTRVLLDILHDSGPQRAFPEFIKSLEKVYPHVANKLKAGTCAK